MTPAAAPISQDGQVSLSRKSHYLESAGADPAPATKGVHALYIMNSSVRYTDKNKNTHTALTRILIDKLPPATSASTTGAEIKARRYVACGKRYTI